jgi:hypothetical protein
MSSFSAVGLVLYDVIAHLNEDEQHKAEKKIERVLGVGNRQPTKEERILFEEWLLFEWRDVTGESLIDRALRDGSLTVEQEERCRVLQQTNIYSYWGAKDIVPGYGFTLIDRYTKQPYRVVAPELAGQFDENAFFAARICQIDGKWRMCSGRVQIRSLVFTNESEKTFFSNKPKDFGILYVNSGSGIPDTKTSVPDYEQAVKNFDGILNRTDLSKFISSDTVVAWMKRADTERNKLHFASVINIILGLAYGLPQDLVSELLEATQHLQIAWREKNPVIVQRNLDNDVGPLHTILEIDPDMWREQFDEAVQLSHEGRQKDAYEQYRKSFAILIDKQGVFSDIYRFVYNAAMAVMYTNPKLARKLAGMSLDINPKYDLALDFVRKFDAGDLDDAIRNANLLQKVQAMEQLLVSKRGGWMTEEQAKELRKKQRSARAKFFSNAVERVVSKEITDYVKWLKTLKINFEDGTKTTSISTYNALGEVVHSSKLGRNDPCYCGSKKKFKKCHG